MGRKLHVYNTVTGGEDKCATRVRAIQQTFSICKDNFSILQTLMASIYYTRRISIRAVHFRGIDPMTPVETATNLPTLKG